MIDPLEQERVMMSEQAAACAHLAVSYRTEPVDDDEYTRGFYIRGWWECDSDCGAVFVPEARLSKMEEALLQIRDDTLAWEEANHIAEEALAGEREET